MNQEYLSEQEEELLSSVSDLEIQEDNKLKTTINESMNEDFKEFLNQNENFFNNDQIQSDTEQEEERFQLEKEQYEQTEPLIPREGQLDLFDQSKNQNSIIYLPTGSGKTMIALMHIYYQLKKHGAQNVKIIFLANTIQLVEQQALYLKKNIFSVAAYMENKNLVSQEFQFNIEQFKDRQFLKQFIIPIHSKAAYNNEDQDYSGWDYDRWMNIKNESTVLVMMGQMLLNALRRGYLKLPYFSLLIFDECHHCKQNHPYRLIVKEFLEDQQVASKIQNSDKVQILGLTASPVLKIDLNQAYKNSRIDSRKIEIELLELAKNLRSRYKFRLDTLQKLTQPNIQIYQAEQGINIHQIDCENISKFYKNLLNLELDIQKQQNQSISFGIQLYLQQLINYAIYQGVIILKDLGKKSFHQFITEMQKNVNKVESNKLQNDKQLLIKISQYFDTFLKKQEQQPQEMSPKFVALLNYLNQIKDQQQKIILFVDQKIIAKYINQLLKDNQFECNYVVGTGNNSSSSLQQEILSKHNTLQLLNDFEPQNLLTKANQLYEVFRDRDADIEIGDENKNRDQDILKTQLQELSQGIEKLGKDLDQAVLDAKQQKEIIQQFKDDKFNILISTNVTEEGFDIPECNRVVLYGETTTFKSYIQKTGRARKDQSEVVMIVDQTQEKKQKSLYNIIEKTLDCIQNKIQLINNDIQTLEQLEQKISMLQREIKKENQNAVQTNDFYERAIIKDSQALLNTNWAVEILSNFANVFRASDNKNFIKGVFYAYTQIPAVGFRCIIILPKNTVERFFIGDLLANKEDAKRSAAFKAVKLLKIKNMLTADLRPIRSSIRFSVDSRDDPNLDNPQYKEIINQVSIIKYESQKIDMSQKLFPFKFDSLNIEINKEVYLYQFEFQYQSRQEEDDCCWQKMGNTSMIGMIHDVEIKKPQILVEGNKVKLERVGKITISKEEYEELLQIHQFIVATQMDWDIEYYSEITGDPIQPNSCLYQQKKTNPFKSFVVDKKIALFVLLKKQENEYKIDLDLNQRILQFKEKMIEVFKFLNTIKQKKKDNKLAKQQRERLGNDLKIVNQTWTKMLVEQSTVNLIKKNEFSTMVVQNISENYHLGKMVVMSKANENDKPEQDRKDKLHSIIRGEFNHDTLIDTRVLRKFLKKDISKFLCRQISINKRKSKFEYYMEEFYRYPLDIDMCLKLRVLFKAFMPYVRDLFVAKQLQNNQIFNNLCIVEGQIYKYKIMDNTLVSNSQNFVKFLEQQEKKYKHLIDHFIKAKNIQVDLGKVQILDQFKQEEKVEQHKSFLITHIDDGLIFQALQSQSYNSDESTNYQVLEFLGDAILKLLGSIQVFVDYPFANEYIMHVYRAKLVSNENLRKICILNKLFEYILSYKFDYYPQGFETETSRPLNKQEASKNDQNIRYKAKFQGQEIDQIPNNYQHIPDKVHSDVIEALNGTFMRQYNNIDACQTYFYQLKVLDYPTTDLILQYSNTMECKGLLGEMLYNLQLIIGYDFHDQSLLIQALTHPKMTDLIDLFIQHKDKDFQILKSVSLDYNFKILKSGKIDEDLIKKLNELQFRSDLTYDRLEFLGDSVLDAVVVEWLVQQFPKDHPEDLSLKKQCIVCNKALALVTLRYGLHYFLLHPTIHYKGHSDNLVLEKLKANYDEYYEDISKLYTQEPTVKILGDVFEAIIGAIFVDCKFNYNMIGEIIKKLMLKEFMEYFSSPNQIQKNPQDRLSKKYKGKNIQIRMTDSPPIDGESEFVVQSDEGTIFNKVRAVSEKQAREKILEEQEQERKGLK